MKADQKVVIVTGASRGIGAGVVKAFRQAGYAVVGTSRSIGPQTDAEIVSIAGSIEDRAHAERVVATAVERFGRVDTLVNNAGLFVSKPFTEYTVEDFQRVMDVNLAGFFHITQFALAQMVKRGAGHIVQVTTSLVDQALSDVPSGLATLSKGGLDAVTRGLAIEYAKRGIRVNAVSPGIIRTPMHPAEAHGFLDRLHPVGRMGEISDIADAVLYLERAGFVTGETLRVDGGQHAGRW